MKILFLTIGSSLVASTRVRVYGYIPYFEKKGIRYKIINYTSKGKCKRLLNLKRDSAPQFIFEMFYKLCILLKFLIHAPFYDLVFIQKAIMPRLAWNLVRLLNRRIVFDFDDALHLHKDIRYVLKGSLLVVVSNEYLKDYASDYNRNLHVLPSPVHIGGQAASKNRDNLVIGWVGSPEASGYLDFLMPVFRKLKERFTNLDISFMGAGKKSEFEKLNLESLPWSPEGEKRYLGNIDVGIMPLRNDEWSRGKAGYKLLLYMSEGVPCVATPIGVNREIIKEGETGFFAISERDWIDKISILLEDRDLALEIGNKGREEVKKLYSYDRLFPQFLNMLKALKI